MLSLQAMFWANWAMVLTLPDPSSVFHFLFFLSVVLWWRSPRKCALLVFRLFLNVEGSGESLSPFCVPTPILNLKACLWVLNCFHTMRLVPLVCLQLFKFLSCYRAKGKMFLVSRASLEDASRQGGRGSEGRSQDRATFSPISFPKLLLGNEPCKQAELVGNDFLKP